MRYRLGLQRPDVGEKTAAEPSATVACSATAVSGEGADRTARPIFWASYFGWLLEGFDSAIYAVVGLVLLPLARKTRGQAVPE